MKKISRTRVVLFSLFIMLIACQTILAQTYSTNFDGISNCIGCSGTISKVTNVSSGVGAAGSIKPGSGLAFLVIGIAINALASSSGTSQKDLESKQAELQKINAQNAREQAIKDSLANVLHAKLMTLYKPLPGMQHHSVTYSTPDPPPSLVMKPLPPDNTTLPTENQPADNAPASTGTDLFGENNVKNPDLGNTDGNSIEAIKQNGADQFHDHTLSPQSAGNDATGQDNDFAVVTNSALTNLPRDYHKFTAKEKEAMFVVLGIVAGPGAGIVAAEFGASADAIWVYSRVADLSVPLIQNKLSDKTIEEVDKQSINFFFGEVGENTFTLVKVGYDVWQLVRVPKPPKPKPEQTWNPSPTTN